MNQNYNKNNGLKNKNAFALNLKGPTSNKQITNNDKINNSNPPLALPSEQIDNENYLQSKLVNIKMKQKQK